MLRIRRWKAALPPIALVASFMVVACSDPMSETDPDPPDDGPPRWTDVSLGFDHTCGLRSDGTVFCWGGNGRHQVTPDEVESLDLPTEVLVSGQAVDVEASDEGACARRSDDSRQCWGMNWSGQLGVSGDTILETPTSSAGPDIERSSLGAMHGCGVDADRGAWCWGGGGAAPGREMTLGSPMTETCPAPTGLHSTSCSPSPLQITLPEQARSAGAGIFYSCALGTSGTAYCWGYRPWGQLGDGTDVPSDPADFGRYDAQPVAGGLAFAQLSVGNSYSCGVTTAGAAYCWGHSGTTSPLGRLGDGTADAENEGSRAPVAVAGGMVFESVSTPRANHIRAAHTCGLMSDGSLACWGSNEYGQLGLVETRSECGVDIACEVEPASVGGLPSLVQVELGAHHTCGLTSGGELYCWGRNHMGQLGLGDRTDRSEPTMVELPD